MANNPPANERFVYIEWFGPFSYGPDGLAPSVRDLGSPTAKDFDRLLTKPGLYMVYGDHPVHGDRALLYIGKANPLDRRLKEQQFWLQYEWRLEIYLSSVLQSNLDDVEKLLIYAHSPPYNSYCISMVPKLNGPIRIWNDGKLSKLYPEISSAHPWYEEY